MLGRLVNLACSDIRTLIWKFFLARRPLRVQSLFSISLLTVRMAVSRDGVFAISNAGDGHTLIYGGVKLLHPTGFEGLDEHPITMSEPFDLGTGKQFVDFRR